MNLHRGEVEIVVGEGESAKRLTLKFGTNEFVKLEDALGLKGGALMVGLARNTGFKDLRTIFRVGLSRCQPDITDDEAGDIIDQLGGITELPEILTRAIAAAVPAQDTEGKAPAAASHSPGIAS